MNCKQGDMAFIVKNTAQFPLAGRIVEVLSPAPPVPFQLPDGWWNVGSEIASWVVKFQGAPVQAHIYNGIDVRTRDTFYGVCPDRYLRPIRPDAEDTEERRILELFVPVEAPEMVPG